jgi:hypothetical protein
MIHTHGLAIEMWANNRHADVETRQGSRCVLFRRIYPETTPFAGTGGYYIFQCRYSQCGDFTAEPSLQNPSQRKPRCGAPLRKFPHEIELVPCFCFFSCRPITCHTCKNEVSYPIHMHCGCYKFTNSQYKSQVSWFLQTCKHLFKNTSTRQRVSRSH